MMIRQHTTRGGFTGFGPAAAIIAVLAAISACAPAIAEQDAPPEAPQFEDYTEELPADEGGAGGVRFEMVAIPGGRFTMGSPADEPGRREAEGPQVRVDVEPFWIGRHEVTWALYDRFMAEYDLYLRRPERRVEAGQGDAGADAVSLPTPLYDPGHTFEKGHEPDQPAATMTQFAARQFTKWLSLKTGRIYRLPTEAEWEYACRAGTETAYGFGDDPAALADHAWYFDNADDRYHTVGLKKPNGWGLHDMHGNVAEWVLDAFIADHYATLAAEAPVPAAEAVAWPKSEYPRVVRGGSWFDFAEDLRCASRQPSSDEWSEQDPQLPQSVWWHTDARFVGFRIVRPLRTPTAEQLDRYWEPDAPLIRDVIDLDEKQIRIRLEDARPLPGPASP